MATSKDMSKGNPMGLIIGFAAPLLVGLIFQQVYNLVDTIIVGQFLGKNALAGVGATGSINFLIVGFCLGVCSGFALPVAQMYGAKNFNALKKYVGNAAVLSIIIGAAMTILTVIFCRNILVLMQTPSTILDLSYQYIIVIFAGIPATMLYNILSGFLRSLGNSKAPVVFLVISAVLNICLDLIFILVFNWGVFGAAFATILSQAVSGILCFIYIMVSVPLLHTCRLDWQLDGQYVKNLLLMGLPMGFQYSITAIGSVILQASVNSLGEDAVAAMTAAGKISMFGMCPFDALGSTMATYGGQNVGAGKLERLKKGLFSAGIIGAIYSVLFVIIIYFFGNNLIMLFVKKSETQVIAWGYEFILINALFYIFLMLVNTVRFMIQGMGFSGFAIFAGVFEMVARSVVGLGFVPIFGFTAACYASPMAWVFADMFLIPAFIFCQNRLKKRMQPKEPHII